MTTETVGEGESGSVCTGLNCTCPSPGTPVADPRKRCVGAPPDAPGRRPSAHRAVVVSIGWSTTAQQPLRGVAQTLLPPPPAVRRARAGRGPPGASGYVLEATDVGSRAGPRLARDVEAGIDGR